jgi:hypothetical protein
MIAALIYLIVAVIILGVVWWAVQQLLPLIPLGEPFRTILRVLIVLLTVLIVIWVIFQVLGIAGLGGHIPSLR